MRIGIFTDTYTPDINGVVSSVVTLQNGLEQAGHEVYIITGQKNSFHAHWEGNVLRLPGIEMKKLYGYTLSTPYHFEVKREIESLHLDVIHVQQEFTVGIFGRILAHNLHIPVVYTYHTLYEDYTHYVNVFDLNSVEKISRKAIYSISRMLCNSVSGIIAPSEKTKEKLIGYGVKKPIYVIPTGLDLDRFRYENMEEQKRRAIREKYHLDEDTPLIIYLGRIAAEKSIDVIIDGVKHIQTENCKVMIVGGGPSLEDLKEQAQKLGVSDRMIFTGPVPAEEVPAYYQISDAFVSASTSETQGMTFIEALASGLPLFARPDEVLEQLVDEGRSGFYFSTPEEFAQKADAYLAMPKEKKQEMKKEAIERSMRYDMHEFAHQVEVVYRKVIDEYQEDYEVTKIRVLDDVVKVTLENDAQKEPLRLYISMDDYFTYKITLHRYLDADYVASLVEQQDMIKATRSAVHRLSGRDYTCKEMLRYLMLNKELDQESAQKVIADLKERGYLNDERYAQEKTQYYSSQGYGREKISRMLIKKGIDRETAQAAVSTLEDSQEEENAFLLAEKLTDTIKDRSKKMKRQMIVSKLMAQGYSAEIARRAASHLEFDEEEEAGALTKNVEKAWRLYKNRYDGTVLRQKVVAYCMRKGFSAAAVHEKIEEQELDDDE